MDLLEKSSEVIERILPDNRFGLEIRLDEHKRHLRSVREHYSEFQPEDWVDEGERERAIETNTVWMLRWWPGTPLECHVALSATFFGLVKYMARYFLASKRA